MNASPIAQGTTEPSASASPSSEVTQDTRHEEIRDPLDFDNAEEDIEYSVGSGYIYDNEQIRDLLTDRFGGRRARVEVRKRELLNATTSVGPRNNPQVWKVVEGIPPGNSEFNEFLELGLRSNTLDFEALPLRLRTRAEITRGNRSSPRISPGLVAQSDEQLAIKSIFFSLYPVNWRQSLKRLNIHITENNRISRSRDLDVSQNEYWKFVGLLLLCAVQKSKGIEGIYDNKETEGIISKVPASKYIEKKSFLFIKKHWVSQFHLEVDDENKERNKWWRVGFLINGFNANRKETIASSRIKTLDESMSAFRPQTRSTGNLPNISFVWRKPEPLGTELKTVASAGSNGPIVHAEVQEGKIGMRNKKFYNSHGSYCACTLRLVEATIDSGQKPDASSKNLYYVDSWFASLKAAIAITEDLGADFVGPIKNSHALFPKNFLETEMKQWPPGTHLVLETTVRNNRYYAIGYKYNMENVKAKH